MVHLQDLTSVTSVVPRGLAQVGEEWYVVDAYLVVSHIRNHPASRMVDVT